MLFRQSLKVSDELLFGFIDLRSNERPYFPLELLPEVATSQSSGIATVETKRDCLYWIADDSQASSPINWKEKDALLYEQYISFISCLNSIL